MLILVFAQVLPVSNEGAYACEMSLLHFPAVEVLQSKFPLRYWSTGNLHFSFHFLKALRVNYSEELWNFFGSGRKLTTQQKVSVVPFCPTMTSQRGIKSYKVKVVGIFGPSRSLGLQEQEKVPKWVKKNKSPKHPSLLKSKPF